MILQRDKQLDAADSFLTALTLYREAKTNADYMRCIRSAAEATDLTREVLVARGYSVADYQTFKGLALSELLTTEAKYLLLLAIENFKTLTISETYLSQQGYQALIAVLNSTDPLHATAQN